MKTIELERTALNSRIARFNELSPLDIQKDSSIPLPAKDLIYSRKLMSVIGLDQESKTPINANAPVVGAGGITITYAACPPGTGPSLHAHHKTFETFTVLKGRFEFSLNDDGAEKFILEPFDVISVPPRINRCFRCIDDEEGILQVVISGGVHDLNDIDMAPSVGEKLREYGPEVHKRFADVGFTFNAHKNGIG
ncbi:cupin domain-containing protein [Pseudomonas sp. NPDC089401]|uniref:cupin domain-containing protein n=1 Tax=Pseudomonas sp. NPDC089401 TaxID=3364462 RepID=UPI0038112F86